MENAKLAKARKDVNSRVLEFLTSMIEDDPKRDLCVQLKYQIELYPTLLESFAQTVDANTKDNDDNNVQKKSRTTKKTLDIPLNGRFNVVQPLHRQLLDFAECELPDGLSDDFLTALNEKSDAYEILHELHSTRVLGLGDSIALKTGPYVEMDEVSNLLYVRSKTPDVPTPTCLGAFQCDKRPYFFMSRASGVTLESVWLELSRPQKLSIRSQLNEIFGKLRAQDYDTSTDQLKLGSFASGICRDTRRDQRVSEQTISTEADFNNFLYHAPPRTATDLIKAARSTMREDHRIVMTHGDLHPRNIMVSWGDVQESGESVTNRALTITSIIDWELAGWYPDYWEYVKALNTITSRGLRDWPNYLPLEAIGCPVTEYAVDCLIDRWLGQ
ncbi:hypothetical protein G7046_g6314 [Stylonectria norvegica]|nr:hypothetical protein G7046_g6314 [Stylonectria norvegica]